jgi:hypothetical protein
MNLRVPCNAGKFLSCYTIGSFSRRAQLHEWVSEWSRKRFLICVQNVPWSNIGRVLWSFAVLFSFKMNDRILLRNRSQPIPLKSLPTQN